MTRTAKAGDVSGTSVIISADATDDSGVIGVRFLLDGVQMAPEDTSAPYSIVWDSTSVPNGSYTLTAEARDAAGNVGVSVPITVTVNNVSGGVDDMPVPPSETSSVSVDVVSDSWGGGGDTMAPVVQTTGPAPGGSVSASVVVTANATDNVGVVGVQFLLDGSPIGQEDTTAPYAVNWNTTSASNGTHILSARARDAAGNQATSAGVAVTVDNTAGEEDLPGPATGNGTVDLRVEKSTAEYRRIRASSDVGTALELYIDGQLTTTVSGTSLVYDWNIRPLVGSHEVRVVATDATEVAASTSMFYSVGSAYTPLVTLDIRQIPIVGARVVRGLTDLGVPTRLELYVDGELVAGKGGTQIEYAWDPGSTPQDVLFVAYDSFGVVASVSVLSGPDR